MKLARSLRRVRTSYAFSSRRGRKSLPALSLLTPPPTQESCPTNPCPSKSPSASTSSPSSSLRGPSPHSTPLRYQSPHGSTDLAPRLALPLPSRDPTKDHKDVEARHEAHLAKLKSDAKAENDHVRWSTGRGARHPPHPFLEVGKADGSLVGFRPRRSLRSTRRSLPASPSRRSTLPTSLSRIPPKEEGPKQGGWRTP